ncbi:hypothetical protein QCA50_004253 [Cerrena zonata]|uniref:HhH-GPD domain-containing protein n=1 Tax=Cerrena zonata TaxID=2478898 RepID=A0AAW0GIN7_9APHY
MLAPFLRRIIYLSLCPHVQSLRYPSRNLLRSCLITKMPVTRSASTRTTRASTRAKAVEEAVASDIDSGVESEVAPKKAGTKRKARATNGRKAPAKRAKAAPKPVEETPEDLNVELPPPSVPADDPSRNLVPATLTFSFEDAKKHLISVDSRFEILFTRLKCRPYEHLQQFDPFSTLATSILGQQISWKAARSIQHRFIRLFNPGLPESVNVPYDKDAYFPTATQVAGEDLAVLKSAGLSGRKAEYIRDLAERFADGRLTTEKLLNADDDELHDLLTEWTCSPYSLFVDLTYYLSPTLECNEGSATGSSPYTIENSTSASPQTNFLYALTTKRACKLKLLGKQLQYLLCLSPPTTVHLPQVHLRPKMRRAFLQLPLSRVRPNLRVRTP